MSAKVMVLEKNVFDFFKIHGRFLFLMGLYLLLVLSSFIAPHAFAGTTQGDLSAVDTHVKSEVTGDVLDIIAWVSFGLTVITAAAKMSLGVVITFFGIFLVLILGPTVISAHFSALI